MCSPEYSRQSIGWRELCRLKARAITSWGGDRKHGKIRATSDSVFLKVRSQAGKRVVYEFKAIRPHIYAREFKGFEE